ncbi:MAG: hypothetical protein WCT05_11150 [Lentisphaeria bacterium]
MKKILRVVFWLLLPVCAVAGICEYEISIPLQGKTALLSLDLPAEALISLGGLPEGLRIFDRRGQVVPWLREQKKEGAIECIQESCPGTPTLVKETEEGGLELYFELSKDAPQPNGLSLETSLNNFEQSVEVWGWEENSWHCLLPDGFIFDSSRVLNLRNVELTFNSQKCRKFKLRISRAALERQAELRSVQESWSNGQPGETIAAGNVRTQAFKIDAVHFWRRFDQQISKQPCWLDADSGSLAGSILPEQKQTLVELVPTCYPICGIRIESAEPNFSRKVKVLQKKKHGEEIFLTEESVWAIDLPNYQKNHMELFFPPVQTGKLLVIFADGDSPPLQLQKIFFLIPEYQLLFFAEPDFLPYRLTVDADGKEPDYNNAELIRQAQQKTQALKVTLLERKGEALSLQRSQQKSTIPRGWLYAALCLAVAAIAYALFIAARKNINVEDS